MTPAPKPVIVLRFSAMGDVALLTPVLKSFLATYPDLKITVVSRPRFSAFFVSQPNLDFFPADVDGAHGGVGGLAKLFLQLNRMKPSMVIDMHDHLRSRFICFLFRIIGVKIVRFEKGRGEKKQLTRKNGKIRKELPHTVQRYANAFAKAGLPFPMVKSPYIETSSESERRLSAWLATENLVKQQTWYGLAPFAAHQTKIWPLENYVKLIAESQKRLPAKFFLFGGGAGEITFFQQLHLRFPDRCVIVAGKLSLPEELALMKRLDKMICVDSSNMHLAALLGVPTVTIWGGTHPAAGFGPYGEIGNRLIQIDPGVLPCRPCSVYGKNSCWRGDLACMNGITVNHVLSEL